MTALKASDVDAFVARPDTARPVVLIYGPDSGLVSERAQAIVRVSVDNPDDPFSLVRIEGDDLSGNPLRLVEEANTIPLFGGRRAIWVKADQPQYRPRGRSADRRDLARLPRGDRGRGSEKILAAARRVRTREERRGVALLRRRRARARAPDRR